MNQRPDAGLGMLRAFAPIVIVGASGALIRASSFFELAVAVANTLFGLGSGAALATVMGVLVEVLVMLSVCNVCSRTRGWYGRGALRGGPARP